MVRSGSEVQLCRGRGRRIVVRGADISRADCPNAIDSERLAAGILQ